MNKCFLAALVLGGMYALVGCANSTTNTSQDPIVGTWNWTSETVDGQPITLASVGEASIVFTFAADNTYSSVGTPISGSPTTSSGTWSKSGSTYTISQTTAPTNSGTATITGSTMTMNVNDNNSAVVLIVTKQ